MTRRGLIGALIGAATLDPERLLWVPGQRVISIPKPVPVKIGHTLYLRMPIRYSPLAAMLPIQREINRLNSEQIEINELWWRFRA